MGAAANAARAVGLSSDKAEPGSAAVSTHKQ